MVSNSYRPEDGWEEDDDPPPPIHACDSHPKYKREYAQIAKAMSELGATDTEMAVAFGVARPMISHWRIKHPEFAEATKIGKAPADDRVERSFYQRAVGYDIETEKIFCNKDGQIIRAKTIEHIPGETKAAALWLCNRRRNEWSLESTVKLTGPRGGPLQVINTHMTVEEASRLYEESLEMIVDDSTGT